MSALMAGGGAGCLVSCAVGELVIEVERVRGLRFDDGAPVRAASGVARFGAGWLIAQDDGTHAAWCRDGSITALRLFPPVEGLDTFSEHEGTKHLKPDLEAACEIDLGGRSAVVLLGSGSSPARCRGALVIEGVADEGGPAVYWADLTPLYHRAAEALGVAVADLNFEGLCTHGEELRWFNRGNGAAGIASASVDLECAALVDALRGLVPAGGVGVGPARAYDLGTAGGVELAVTDALALGGGHILVSTAAEDTPNAIDDGPVVGAALSILDAGHGVAHHGLVPEVDGVVHKIEGLAWHEGPPEPGATEARILAVVDADDIGVPSLELLLRLRWA